MLRLRSTLLLGVALLGGWASAAPRSELLVLLSIDGFRWDYLDRYEAPTLRQLAACGVRAHRLIPCFPSKTFPNHYSIVTGLYPEHHGIVANWFFDPVRQEAFGMSKPSCNQDARWWGGEPAWITAEKQGIRSACYFWPGSETEQQGLRPSRYKRFDGKESSLQRVDGLLRWLATPGTDRPRFCTLYFDLVDTAGHNFGPDAPETALAVKQADEAVAQLIAGLAQLGLEESTNFVVVSDHGMADCGPDRVIFLEDLLDVSQVQVDFTGPTAGIRPTAGTDLSAMVASIRAKAPSGLQVYLRPDVPARLHYNEGERISPIILIADAPWNIESKIGWPKRQLTYSRGTHGWDPATPEMGALFIASGPAFLRGVTLADVENIHIYNLLCATLGIVPAPNDGDDRLVRAVLVR